MRFGAELTIGMALTAFSAGAFAYVESRAIPETHGDAHHMGHPAGHLGGHMPGHSAMAAQKLSAPVLLGFQRGSLREQREALDDVNEMRSQVQLMRIRHPSAEKCLDRKD